MKSAVVVVGIALTVSTVAVNMTNVVKVIHGLKHKTAVAAKVVVVHPAQKFAHLVANR
jgi:hypothetical protein